MAMPRYMQAMVNAQLWDEQIYEWKSDYIQFLDKCEKIEILLG
jgi:hypothetical protein